MGDVESVSDASVEIFLETSQCESEVNETYENLTNIEKEREKDFTAQLGHLRLLDLLLYDQEDKEVKQREAISNINNDKEWEPFDDEDILEVNPIFSKPFINNRKIVNTIKKEKEWEPFDEVKVVDDNELIQEVNPVFSKPFTHMAVQMWGEVAEIRDIKEGVRDTEGVRDIEGVGVDPFSRKPFSPQFGRKWKAEVIIRKRSNWPVDPRSQ